MELRRTIACLTNTFPRMLDKPWPSPDLQSRRHSQTERQIRGLNQFILPNYHWNRAQLESLLKKEVRTGHAIILLCNHLKPQFGSLLYGICVSYCFKINICLFAVICFLVGCIKWCYRHWRLCNNLITLYPSCKWGLWTFDCFFFQCGTNELCLETMAARTWITEWHCFQATAWVRTVRLAARW